MARGTGPDADRTTAASREAAQILRYLGAGAANTLLAVVVYQLALFVVGYTVSYTIGYLVGIVFGWYAYSRHVFRTSLSVTRLAAFAAFSVTSLVAGAALNAAIVEWLGLQPRLAIFATVAAMLPVNYLGSRWCLRGFGRAHAG